MIKDLKPKQKGVNIMVNIIELSPVKEFDKFGKQGRVANAVAKDDTGSIKLTLWNDEIDKIKEGDKVRISNGYVSEWQGQMQLSTGKFGRLEVVE